MKKRYLFLALTELMITSCGQTGNEGPIDPDDQDNPGDKPVDPIPDDPKDPINPDIETFEKISVLTTYLNEKVPSFEKEKAVSYTRNATQGYQNLYSYDSEVFKEEGRSYSNSTLILKAEISKTKDYPDGDYLEDETTTDSYDFITAVKDNVYYSVVDYKNDDSLDESYKENYNLSNASKYEEYTSISVSDNLVNYFNSFVKGKYLTNGSTDKVTSIVDTTDGSFTSTFALSYDSADDYGKYLCEVNVALDFKKEGYLAGYKFEFEQYAFSVDDYGNYTDETTLIQELSDEVKITYGEKTEYDFKDINPLDYFMTDYDVAVCSFDTIMSTSKVEDINAFPIGEIVRVEATNVVPEKSIDKALTIISSSNTKVISGNDFGEFEAIGEGTTTLTVLSTYGIKKEVEVMVVAPELTSINPRLTSKLHFVGQDEHLYIDFTPENTLEKYYITTENSDIVEVGEIEKLITGTDVATLKFLKAGDVTLKFYREKDDKFLTELKFTVNNPLDDETLKTNLLGAWYGELENTSNGTMIKDAVKIEFNEEGKGGLTLLSNNTGFTLEVNKTYEFTYSYLKTTREDRLEINLSEIKFDVAGTEFTYSSNRAFYYRDGKTLLISFTVADPNYYGYTLEFDAYRK